MALIKTNTPIPTPPKLTKNAEERWIIDPKRKVISP